MTNAELIAKFKAEIERRMKELRGQEQDFLEQDCHTLVEDARLRIGELNQLLSFLDTLEKSEKPIIHTTVTALDNNLNPIEITTDEKPMNQDELGEEIQRFLSNATKMDKGEWKGKYSISKMGFSVVAHYFAQWGAEHLKK